MTVVNVLYLNQTEEMATSMPFQKSEVHSMPFLYLFHFLVQETSNNILLQQEEKIIINSNNLKSLIKARLKQYMNHELPDVQAGFRKGKDPKIKLPTSAGSSKK